MQVNRHNAIAAAILAIGQSLAGAALAEMSPSLSFSGVPGVIDMPTGEALADGNFAVAFSGFGKQTRVTLTFQLSPRLTGSYRTSSTRDWNAVLADSKYDTYTDRSFDIRYLALRETEYLPAVSIGIQDLAGTGIFAGEYVAATKTFGDRVKVTAGLGWGRFGSYGGIGAPFGERPAFEVGNGGKPNFDQWFRGDAAPFAGIEWKVNDRWTVKAEYSSDNYTIESAQRGTFEKKSPFNFGVEYQGANNLRMGIYSLYGSEIGISFNIIFDPKRRGLGGIPGPAPDAVGQRPDAAASWDLDGKNAVRADLSKRLAVDGMSVEHLSYDGTTAHLRVRSEMIDAGPQAIGRAARALSHVMPASVEVFEIVPVVRGMGASKITIRRSDLEALEHVAANDSLLRDRVQITDAGPAPDGGLSDPDIYPKFTWGIAPAIRISAPLRGDVGLRFSASYTLRPGLVLSGSVYKRLAENFDKISHFEEPSKLPHVRSDAHSYNVNSDPALERLTLAWYAKPSPTLYSRVTFGYLERMHAGLSAELLWKPVNSRFALGAELNYSKQRDTDGGLGFGEYDYGIASGHASAYYDFGKGYLGQLDVGRYLAGDYGATISLDREFANGVKLGAYATFTTASAEEFGEGSFDKGIKVTIPLNWVLGQPTQREFSTTVRALERDGGVRLDVQGRLYESIRDYHSGRLDSQWGRVWR